MSHGDDQCLSSDVPLELEGRLTARARGWIDEFVLIGGIGYVLLQWFVFRALRSGVHVLIETRRDVIRIMVVGLLFPWLAFRYLRDALRDPLDYPISRLTLHGPCISWRTRFGRQWDGTVVHYQSFYSKEQLCLKLRVRADST